MQQFAEMYIYIHRLEGTIKITRNKMLIHRKQKRFPIFMCIKFPQENKITAKKKKKRYKALLTEKTMFFLTLIYTIKKSISKILVIILNTRFNIYLNCKPMKTAKNKQKKKGKNRKTDTDSPW